MSVASHTPGPWHLDGHNLSAVIVCDLPRGHPEARHVCGDYSTIARCEGTDWKSNARLIAASPDLLTTAKPFGFCDPDNPPPGVLVEDWRPAVLAIRAAIAKATTP